MFNFGGGQAGGYAKPAEMLSNQTRPTNVRKTTARGHTQTDELRLSKALAKGLNVMSFDYPAFAYHFVNHASGAVILNAFKMFESLINVMATKLDEGDINDNAEMEVAIAAKRIQDAMEIYKA